MISITIILRFNKRDGKGETLISGYMPTGVVFIIISASNSPLLLISSIEIKPASYFNAKVFPFSMDLLMMTSLPLFSFIP